MDLNSGHDFSISQVSSVENDDPLPFQSTFMSNVSHLNPRTVSPPTPNSFLNYSNQVTPSNQFQMNYGFNPTNFTPNLGQQFSFQSMMNAPHLSFESQNSTYSKKKSRKQKNTNQNKDFEQPQPHRRNWTKEEDVALTKAFLHISIDSITGKDQSSDKLWSRIHPVWKEFLANDFEDERSPNGLSKRWCTIQAAVNKFHGAYEQLVRSPASGKSLDDLKRDAHKSYKGTSDDNKPFLFEHCWVECTKNAKWCTQQLTTSSSKRQKLSKGNPTDSNQSTTPSVQNDGGPIDVDSLGMDVINEDGIVRPPGRQVSKEKKKMQCQDKGVVDILSKMQLSLEQQLNHNQEELELKKENVLTLKKEYELREYAMKKELEFKEKELALKEKAQRRRDQQKILNQDLSKLTPLACAAMEKMQEKILKEWEEEDIEI